MIVRFRRTILVIALMATLACSLVLPGYAQTKENFAHRHPTATGIAAGAGTTYLLKRSAKYKREHGERPNFAERHPYLSGVGVAVVTHHVLKKHKTD